MGLKLEGSMGGPVPLTVLAMQVAQQSFEGKCFPGFLNTTAFVFKQEKFSFEAEVME